MTVKKKPAKAPKVNQATQDGRLTAQMLKFVDEYCVDFNGAQAAMRAGYTKSCAKSVASRLLARDDVAEEVKKRQQRQAERTGITSDRWLEEVWGVFTADVNDLVEFRRTCCRHCYGIDYGYQRTVAEMSRDRQAYLLKRSKELSKGADPVTYEDFDEQGGIGYDKRKPPNPDCQECFGEGVGDAYVKDTRTLSPAARALYAGVKLTKDGVQMMVIDKMAAADKLARHLGVYEKDNKQKTDGLAVLLDYIHGRNSRLPIKDPKA